MGDKGNNDTGIEWTHVPGYKGATWNPVRGCTKISPGCKHCYAETFAERFRGVPGHPYEQGFDLRLVPEKLDEPLRKTKPHAYFVNSMSDLHQDGIDEFFLRQTYAVMRASPKHLFMVLTKRPENMRRSIAEMSGKHEPNIALDARHILPPPFFGYEQWAALPNVWLGVSVEDRKYGLPRVDVLRTIPAAVRFLSVEPLLEDLGDIDLTGIHWVIVGGESGHKARPFDLAWARRIRDQCKEQAVPFFFKQTGDRPVEWREAERDSEGNVFGEGVHVPLSHLTKRTARADLPRDLDVREWPRCIADKAGASG